MRSIVRVPSGLRSWLPVGVDSDFPIQNLPYGVFRAAAEEPRVGVAIGDSVLDLARLEAAGAIGAGLLPGGTFARGSLNAFLALGSAAWCAVRSDLVEILRDGSDRLAHHGLRAEDVLFAQASVELLRPFEVGDYVDFYSSIEHASNLGRLFRPGSDPLLPNWRHLPVAYHGRAGSVVANGTVVRRPTAQLVERGGSTPRVQPTAELDIELEVGFVIGPPSRLGEPIPIERAAEHVFGHVLVNDWSARDIQRWEYQPLGPFLGKSFATTVSSWVVPLDALAPYLLPGRPQDPPPLAYLRCEEPLAIDLGLEIALSSERMRRDGRPPAVISQTTFRGLYWNFAQQLAHATVNGAAVRSGDLFASGTVSGATPGSEGSLIELSEGGRKPIPLPDGSTRTFLIDGDRVELRGHCARPGEARVGFGVCHGTIAPAIADPSSSRRP